MSLGFSTGSTQAGCCRAREGRVSRKKKSRLPFLACCNNDRSEKFPLMIIGNAELLRAFNEKYKKELRLEYHFNKKGWMNTPLFIDWLIRLYRYIDITPDRKILVLFDNYSAHESKDTLPSLQKVRVEFFQPNTTSKVQPLDAGIIAWVKAKYKLRLLLRGFESFEAEKKSIYNLDVLTEIRWTEREWDSCPAQFIHNCFTHRLKQGRKDSKENETTDGVREKDTINRMECDAMEYEVAVQRRIRKIF